MPSKLYFGAREQILGKFSMREASQAFQAYQRLYSFHGTFSTLRQELQDRLCDPLMLRMLAEGYQNRQLPEFAPAVLIFDSYYNRLRQRFRGTKLLPFLRAMVATKTATNGPARRAATDLFQVADLMSDDVLHKLAIQQNSSAKMPGDAFVLLEDEGILEALDLEGSIVKFNYDRFYEYLLGLELGRALDVVDTNGFISWFKCQAVALFSEHFSFLEALKSEVVRRNISDRTGPCSFYEAFTLYTLLNDSDRRVQSLAKDIIRELTFEGTEDTLAVLKAVATSDEAWQLLALDIASDSPKIMPILVEALLSGNQTLMRRAVHYLSREVREESVKITFEAMIYEAISRCGITASIARGLFYYSAIILGLQDRLGQDALPAIYGFWRQVARSNGNHWQSSLTTLANEFAVLIKLEGPLFSSAEARLTPIDYLWKHFDPSERALTKELLDAFVNLDKPLTKIQREVILFFGSELRYWRLRRSPEKNPIYAYPFEFRIAEWLLIARAKNSFPEVLAVLGEFASTGFWLSIDFALCNMEFILRHIHSANPSVLANGFQAMKGWTEVFRCAQPARFFATLREKDPFAVNYIPIAQLAAVDLAFNTASNAPIAVLVEEIESGDCDRTKLALLSTRYLWRESPQNALETLRILVGNPDLEITEWVNRILKEIFLVYPRLVEEFFRANHLSADRMRQIKDREDVEDSVGFRHDGDPLFKVLFLGGLDRRKQVALWYQRLLQAGSVEAFSRELVATLAELLSCGSAKATL